MKRVGRVIEKQGESLSVCFSRPEACGSCSMCGSGRDNTTVTIKGEARVGDQVEVDMPDAQVLKVSFISYFLPLAGLLLGLWIGTLLFQREFFVMLSGFAVMGIAFVVLKAIDKKAAKSSQWQPKLIRIINENEEPVEEPEPTKV